MAVALFLAGAAERHAMQHGDIVLNHRGLADDNAGGVVEEYAAADLRGRMDVHREQRRHPALDEPGQRTTTVPPQPMRHAIALQRMESFEEQESLRIGL